MKAAKFLLSAIAVVGAHEALALSYECNAFNFPQNQTGNATGINNAGYVVGYYGTHGFILTPSGEFTQIDRPGGTNTKLFQINNLNEATGQYSDAQGAIHYFTIQQNHYVQDVTLPAPYSSSPFSIYGINDNGQISGFLPTPQPQYPTGAFFILDPDHNITLVNSFGATSPTPRPGPLNNAGELLEMNDPTTLEGSTYVRLPNNTIYASAPPYPPPALGGYTGVNNAGTLIGPVYLTQYGGSSGPSIGGTDNGADGAFVEFLCYGESFANSYIPFAINDNNVVTGSSPAGMFIATPRTGEPFIDAPTGRTFTPTPAGQPTPTSRLTLTNSGTVRVYLTNARLIGAYPSAFHMNGCGNGGPVELDPGVGCSIYVYGIPLPNVLTTATILVDDNATFNAPTQIVLTAPTPGQQ